VDQSSILQCKSYNKKDDTLVKLFQTLAHLTYFSLCNITKWILHGAKETTNHLGYTPLITALSRAVSPRPSLCTTIPIPKTVSYKVYGSISWE